LDLGAHIKEPFDQEDPESIKQFMYDARSFTIEVQNISIKNENTYDEWEILLIYDIIENYIHS
jgi:hypothetical protein